MARRKGKTKAQWVTEEIAQAVGAGKTAQVDVVNFSELTAPPPVLKLISPSCRSTNLRKSNPRQGPGVSLSMQ